MFPGLGIWVKNKISGLLYLGNHDSQTNQTNLPVSYKDKKLNFYIFTY